MIEQLARPENAPVAFLGRGHGQRTALLLKSSTLWWVLHGFLEGGLHARWGELGRGARAVRTAFYTKSSTLWGAASFVLHGFMELERISALEFYRRLP